MADLIPDFILNARETGITKGNFRSCCMFIDISGFTKMTNRLIKYQKDGAETISNIIDEVFSHSIDEVYKAGGFVSSFAGDAFMAIFQTDIPEIPLKTAYKIKSIFSRNACIKTRFGNFRLIAKIGLSYGDIQFSIIDSKVHNVYYFFGKAIDNSAIAQQKASRMQIISDRDFKNKLSYIVPSRIIDKDWYSYYTIKQNIKTPNLNIETERSMPDGRQNIFLPMSLVNKQEKGEFREIVSCFINISDDSDFDHVIKEIITRCYAYGGYFNRAESSDKGRTVLILFGAPSGIEGLYIRSADFCLSLRNIPKLRFRIGLASGISFAGFTGSNIRREYTALGGVVSMSARIMASSEWMNINADEKLADHLSKTHQMRPIGPYKFKGFKKEKKVYLLDSKKENDVFMGSPKFYIERKCEKNQLTELISPILNKKFGGTIFIDGKAGIGKTSFINNYFSDQNRYKFYFLHCDTILQKAFNPFSGFFSKFFNLSDFDKEFLFRRKYADFVSKIIDPELKKELIRTESFIAGLIGIEWDGSLFSQLDSKLRYNNIILAVKNFYKALSIINPYCLIIEDCNFIDEDSIILLDRLTQNIENYPFAIIALVRFNDDGKRFNFMQEFPVSGRVELQSFDKAMTSQIILKMLNKDKIPEETYDFVFNKSQGNPFYTVQIVLYLTENKLFRPDYSLKTYSDSIPSAIWQLIISRVDRLNDHIRNALLSASVIGKEIDISILEYLLKHLDIAKNNTDFQKIIQEGIREQIWTFINNERLVFISSLIRDVLYDIQLKTKLRNLHRITGGIIETLYSNNLMDYCEELAMHFKKSGDVQKAVFYLNNAIDRAKTYYQNNKIIYLYDSLLGLEKEKNDNEKIYDIFSNKAYIYRLLGKLSDSLSLYQKALKLSRKIKNVEYEINCLSSIAYLLINTSRSDEAINILDKALNLSEKISYKQGIRSVLCNIGIYQYTIGNYAKSIEYYEKMFEICKEINDKKGISLYYGNTGLLYTEMGHYKEAIACYENQISICKEINDKSGISLAYGNLGIVYNYFGNLEKAMEYYQKQLEISQEIGDIQGISLAFGNIGNLHYNKLEYLDALSFFEKQLKLSHETKNIRAASYALGNIGNVYWSQNKIDQAIQAYKRQLAICKKSGDKKGRSLAIGNIGLLHLTKGEFSKAKGSLSEKLLLSSEIGDNIGIIFSLGYLGKLHEYQNHYEKSLDFYAKSIKKAEEFGIIDYFLLFSIFKVSLLAENLFLKEAEAIAKDLLSIASVYKQSNNIFLLELILCRLQKDVFSLLNMKYTEGFDEAQSAEINYELWNLTGNEYYRKTSKDLYDSLYNKTLNYAYKSRLNKLK